MKPVLIAASLLLAASAPAVIASQFVELDFATVCIAFVGGYTAVGILAIAVSDYSRKDRRVRRPVRQPEPSPAAAGTPADVAPVAASFSCHPFSA